MAINPGDVTKLLSLIQAQEPNAEERLASIIYDALRKLAASQMRRERSDHTLSPTALANEAWLRFGEELPHSDVSCRQKFFAVAVTAMRRVLVDHARARNAEKRGGAYRPVRVESLDDFSAPTDRQLIALNDALEALAALRPRTAHVVELRFFGGFSHSDIAALLGLERRTVDRDWAFARAWLASQLGVGAASEAPAFNRVPKAP